MKLLKKSVLTLELNAQKKIQVDEGVYIANKVDALKKSLSELEEQHRTFIETKQIEIDNHFKTLEREIKEKKAEILTLEQKRNQLLKPLDEEHEKLNQYKVELVIQEKEFSKRFIKLKESEKLIDIKANDLDLQMKTLGTRIKANEEETRKTKNNFRKSEEALKSATEQKYEVERYITSKTTILLDREANITIRERELAMALKQITNREKEIINKQILLEDREATLEREIKRQQNKWQQ